MRMSGYKQLRWISVNFIADPKVISVWITTNVGHPNIQTFNHKTQIKWICLPYFFSVDISINTSQRFKVGKFINQGHIAKIPGMPYLVHIFKMLKNGIVKKAVGIRKEAYFFHISNVQFRICF